MSKDADASLSLTNDPGGGSHDEVDGRHCLALVSGHRTAHHPYAVVEPHPVHANSMVVASSSNPDAPIKPTLGRIRRHPGHLAGRRRSGNTLYARKYYIIRGVADIFWVPSFGDAMFKRPNSTSSPVPIEHRSGGFVTQPLAKIEWVIGRHLTLP